MSNSLPVLVFTSVATWAAAASDAPVSVDLADRYAQAILRSSNDQDANTRLREVEPQLADRTWALPVLFERIARGTATDNHWLALRKLNTWGDGAWHLEMDGAAFDGLAANPEAFGKRYLQGDDFGLVVLQYALDWAIEAPEVGGLDCSPSGLAEADHFVRVVRESLDAARKLRSKATEQQATRADILVGAHSVIDSTLVPSLNDFRESCKDSTEQ